MNSSWTVDMSYLMLRDRDFLLTKVLPRLSKSVVLISAAVSGSRRSATGVLIMYVLPDAERQGCSAYESAASSLERECILIVWQQHTGGT